MAGFKTTSLTALAIALTGFSATAQISQDVLMPADTYDAGVLAQNDGGLGPDLWQGTSAERAISLLGGIKLTQKFGAKDLIRAVILSGGVPPRAQDGLTREQYIAARLQAILTLGNTEAFNQITSSSSLNMTTPSTLKLSVEHALLSGDVQNACSVADSITLERKAPYWAKLRSYCHFTKDEIPAAELTSDLLQRAGHEDDIFYSLLGVLTGSQVKFPKTSEVKTPLHISMARQAIKTKGFKAPKLKQINTYPPALAATLAQDETQTPEVRFAALTRSAHYLTTEQLGQILSGFTDAPLINISDLPKDTWTAKHWGQALGAIRASTDMANAANLASMLLSQADSLGIFTPISKLLVSEISIIPSTFQAKENPKMFARLAVQNRDLSALGGLYLELPDDNPLKARIALASDALGGGFMLGDLGIDIETRLQLKGAKKTRAVRDAYLAYGLGAKLSNTAIDTLIKAQTMQGQTANPGAALALQDATKRRAQAETALWAAHIFGQYSPAELRADTLATVFLAFGEVNLSHISGQLAAYDFLETSE